MNKKLLFLICFSLFLSSKAYSQDASNELGNQNQSWYASASYATAIWSSDYWNEDYFSFKPDAVVSHESPRFKNFNNYSFSFGYRTGKFQTDLVYEDFGTINWVVGTTVDRNPRTYDSGEMQVESTNLMLQLSYDLHQIDKTQLFLLAGVGQSEHSVDTAYLNILGTTIEYADPNSTNHTSYRVGMGIRHPITDNLSIETKLNYSDYGKAYVYDASTGYSSYNIKMQAVEAGVSLKYYF